MHQAYMRASTTQPADDDVPGAGGHRPLMQMQSTGSLHVRSPASNPSWVLLNQVGARLDNFPGDRTTSATSSTSNGEEISVSFELVEPPGISVLTVDCPRNYDGNVIAAHRDVVLLAITIPFRTSGDLFVYQASRDADDPSRRRRPCLMLLPDSTMRTKFGIMSCTSNDVNDDPPSFVVAQLRVNGKVRVFRSESGQWKSFRNLHVHGADAGDLRWWSTDEVVPYDCRRRRRMIWVDYYRGMVIMDLSSQTDSKKTMTNPTPPPPRLRYVPLPVDRVGDPDIYDHRGRPRACRGVCVTRYGIKFVSVDTMRMSNFGVIGNPYSLKWSERFRVTTWSLREDDDYMWKKDVTMHEEEFWDAFDGGDRFPFPHVQPGFPVVDVDNPDIVAFRLEKPDNIYPWMIEKPDNPWMIEVDLKKKVLLAATAYSKKESDSLSAGDAETIINSASVSHYEPIPSYKDGGQAYKKGTQSVAEDSVGRGMALAIPQFCRVRPCKLLVAMLVFFSLVNYLMYIAIHMSTAGGLVRPS